MWLDACQYVFAGIVLYFLLMLIVYGTGRMFGLGLKRSIAPPKLMEKEKQLHEAK